MATADDVLTVARRWIGTTEAPPGSNLNPFAAKAGHVDGYAWCASFVVACFREVGITLPSESAWTPTMAEGFKQAGAWFPGGNGLQPGDVTFWDFPDASTGIEHVEIVESLPSGSETIDIGGNTSSGEAGSQDNGGGVFRRRRSRSMIVGYGRPAYSAVPAPGKKVIPMFDPPIVLEPIVAQLVPANGKGVWLYADSGAVYAWGGAPDKGNAKGQPYFAGRHVAHAENLGDGFTIVTTSGERYDYP